MRRNLIAIFILVIFSFFVMSNFVFAQSDISGSGWWSWIQVQRTGESPGDATVNMTAYVPEGDINSNSPFSCGSRTLSVFGATTAFFSHWVADPVGNNCADDPNFPSSFEGSSVLSADHEIVAIAQTQNISYGGWAPGNDPGRANATYRGTSLPSPELRFPLYKLDHYDETTSFYIQNTGSTDAELTATFRPCKNTGQVGVSCLGYPNVYTYTIGNIDSGKTVVFNASLASSNGSFHPSGDNSFGSLVINSDQPIAGVAMEYDPTALKAEFLKANRGFSSNEYDNKYYIPTVKYEYPHDILDPEVTRNRNQSKWSSLIIHNTEVVSVTVNITYTLLERDHSASHPDVGTQYLDGPGEIGPGESKFYLFTDWHETPAGLQPEDLLSAEVSATGDIVIQVTEEGMFIGPGREDLSTYSGMPSTAGANKVAVPLFKEIYKKTFTGIVAQNIGTSTTTVYATFYVVDSENPAITSGDTVKVYKTNVQPGSAARFLVLCWDLWGLEDVTDGSDTLDMADLCANPGANPSGGSNLGVILEADQPLIAQITEEVPWWYSDADVGDGIGIDAASYTGFPLP